MLEQFPKTSLEFPDFNEIRKKIHTQTTHTSAKALKPLLITMAAAAKSNIKRTKEFIYYPALLRKRNVLTSIALLFQEQQHEQLNF